MQLILFDGPSRESLLPLTFTRPVSDLRVGIFKISEKWEYELGIASSPLTVEYLQAKYPCKPDKENLLVNGALLPNQQLSLAIKKLGAEQSLTFEGELLAVRTCKAIAENFSHAAWMEQGAEYEGPVSLVERPWHIFSLNGQEIEADFPRITRDRESGKLSDTVRIDKPENVFVEAGFQGENFTLNASRGPIFLGKDSEIMEGSVIRGPFALCEGAVVKMAAKIYGPTTIGPYCKVGGEINNSVLQANSNKGHDGFLGNSVLGEWCNLGADTNNSNLKNNYGEVKIWDYSSRDYVGTGRQFCGMIMGDHSKCSINTMFNTGTVVGVSANIFGTGFPPTFIPSFSWGGAGGFSEYNFSKALETASLVIERRELELTREDRAILEHIFEYSKDLRN